jgi:predicted GIY-YIG superfamily endonuclease
MPVDCQRPLLLYSMSLLLHLREYRQLVSAVEKIPIYCVFGDPVIKSLAQDRPSTELELASIRGLTDEKRALYGTDILKLVAKARKEDGGTQTQRPPVIVRHPRKMSVLEPWTRRRGLCKTFDASKVHAASKRVPSIPAGKEGVYVLELTQGRVYVGHSGDLRRRVQQHMAGQGSAFTKAFPPTGVLLPRLGCVTGSAEAAERDETLRYMFLRGFQFVRGWRYVRVEMTEHEVQDAEENIRELFDLCRRCGHPGHFVTQCKANFDRLGRPCKR